MPESGETERWDVLLAAWARAFCEPGKNMELVVDARKKPRVQLLLHTSYHLGYSRKEEQALKATAERCGNVVWVRDWLQRAAHLKLMASADALVSTSRAEGFGLPRDLPAGSRQRQAETLGGVG